VLKHLENGYVDKIAHDLGVVLPADRTRLIKETRVRMCPLSGLMEERTIGQVDALFIDVEGHEHHVLKSFPWEKQRPGLIVYEQIHLSPEAAAACETLLKSHCYAFRLAMHIVVTLVERDFIYGACALLNSLTNNGFDGKFVIGYRDHEGMPAKPPDTRTGTELPGKGLITRDQPTPSDSGRIRLWPS